MTIQFGLPKEMLLLQSILSTRVISQDIFIKDRLFTIDESNYINFFIVDDMLKSGNIPPKSYLYDRIKATIINQRKLDILNSINKEILNDALKSRKYEVYK